MIGMIVAMTRDRIIGLDGKIPWHYPADMKRFKRLTIGHTVIMGRRTWESLPPKARPLPDRRNRIVTSRPLSFEDVTNGLRDTSCHASIEHALDWSSHFEGDVWLIGGARIYEAGMKYADVIDVTLVPDEIAEQPGLVHFPSIDLRLEHDGAIQHEDDPRLARQVLRRRAVTGST